MYCPHCGASLPEGARFCRACGGEQGWQGREAPAHKGQRLVGFSPRISDPAFAKYVKNSNRWAAIFSTVLAVAAVIGFYAYGEVGLEMDNPGSLYIGFGIGGMFLVIALFQICGRNRSTTWDGTVEDKKIKKKTETTQDSSTDYLEYSVIIRSDRGKRHMIKNRNTDVLYNYYQIGDRVRHHAGLKSYEKYDKTGDKFIPCNACGTLCDINDDVCFRCKCPLLK